MHDVLHSQPSQVLSTWYANLTLYKVQSRAVFSNAMLCLPDNKLGSVCVVWIPQGKYSTEIETSRKFFTNWHPS